MIRVTMVTSTRLVMLMTLMAASSLRMRRLRLTALLQSPEALQVGHELGDEVVTFQGQVLCLLSQKVVTEVGRDGDHQTHDGGDEGLRQARSHGGGGGRSRQADAAESLENSPDGAQK